MTLKRLPDALQIVNRPTCLDAEHNPPVFADVPAGSYIHSCPTCGNSVRIEVAAVADAVRKETEAAAGVGLVWVLCGHGPGA